METVRFYWKCGYAWAGSRSRANSMVATVGGIILAVAAYGWGFKDGHSDVHPGSYRVWCGCDARINSGNVGLDLFGALCSAARLHRQLEAQFYRRHYLTLSRVLMTTCGLKAV